MRSSRPQHVKRRNKVLCIKNILFIPRSFVRISYLRSLITLLTFIYDFTPRTARYCECGGVIVLVDRFVFLIFSGRLSNNRLASRRHPPTIAEVRAAQPRWVFGYIFHVR